MTSMGGTRFPEGDGRPIFSRQGRAPWWNIERGSICYQPTNYTPIPTPGTSELARHLAAHLAGIDAALGGGPPPGPDNLVTIAGTDNLVTLDTIDNLTVIP
jgi:hypothetical protein